MSLLGPCVGRHLGLVVVRSILLVSHRRHEVGGLFPLITCCLTLPDFAIFTSTLSQLRVSFD